MRFWKSCRIVFYLVDGARWPVVGKGHSYVGGRQQAAHARPRSSKDSSPKLACSSPSIPGLSLAAALADLQCNVRTYLHYLVHMFVLHTA